ncbi:TetR/AcrR family transcriptional regulator [Stenotrophomonas sp. NLF4-10]|uniref:TetR/AcrR family transcriptional regulator n=1 Tax=Stenotrophomonas sp. NLF4-10 TaxID=2918754 RepID=UPI001EFBBDC8|nr:TetR/AcrR family transcriptional regulator [Stenotrophomonas sp. NLF4-10]MCG8276765.1 TetR/AcrR family transcriptional regulator [Stenotrophomonas sp. NLF4-10]
MNTDLSPRAAEIAACARSLLASGGYNGFSYADISESVHISKASIHHHFPSKAELVQVVVARYREEARLGLAMLEQRFPDPLAQLRAYTGYWAACIRDGTSSFCICALLAAELPAIPPQVADEVRGHFRELAAWLASVLAWGASQGAFSLQASPEAEAMAFMAAVHGAMLAARAHGDPEVFAGIVQPLTDRLVSR